MVKLVNVQQPLPETGLTPVFLSDETMAARRQAVLNRMKEEGFDALVIYADLEHGGNWEYLTGFLPRFEESLLVLFQDGSAKLVLGNENLNKAGKSRIPVQAVHMPHFSLPNQPMKTENDVCGILSETGIQNCGNIGIVGWKNFTSELDDNTRLFDIPSYLMDALRKLCPDASLRNGTYLFIGEHGVRTVNNANEFAHYEFGAALAGNGMLEAMNALKPGISEMELGALLNQCGQRNSVVTIAAAGERFEHANMYPSAKTVSIGDKISLTVGFKGGLQSRAGYAVHSEDELPEGQKDYLDKVAIPYQNAVKTWLENIHVGMTGGELYDLIESVLPKETYGWSLNPGHLCADEEWLSSPIYPGSTEVLRSGMLFQIDIIPSVPGYGGASCESGILLADETLKDEIRTQYPELWSRVENRRDYMIHELGIHANEAVLPTSIACAYFRPYLLDQDRALKGTD